MKRCHVSVLVLVIVGLVATGWPSLRASAADTAAQKHLPEVIEFPRQTLTFKPTRDDITVGCVVLTLSSSHPVRVNRTEPDAPYRAIHLRRVATNAFELPALKIEYSINEPGAVLCMSVKVWFNEVSNMGDSPLYESEHRQDRSALVAWCSSTPNPTVGFRFTQNRVGTLSEFKEVLSKPFAIRLNQSPLPAEWGYPMIQNANKLSAADVKDMQKLMRDRGEQYLICISARDSDHADVITSVGDATRFQGMRAYKVARKNGTWQIESVLTHPNMSEFTWW